MTGADARKQAEQQIREEQERAHVSGMRTALKAVADAAKVLADAQGTLAQIEAQTSEEYSASH
jgi:ribosomal protein S20